MTKIQIEEPDGFVKPWGYYVYIHFRESSGTPFYIGKGSGDRYRHSRGKTDWWVNCARKHGVYVEIVQCFEVEDDAYLLEQWLIAKFRHRNENLVNITQGGAGKPLGVKRRPRQPRKAHNAIKVYCSNGMEFHSSEEAARWCVSKGYATARGSKISVVCDVEGRTMYGHAWSRYGTPEKPKFTGAQATINGISKKKSKKVYCSNGMLFKSVTMAAAWCVEQGYERATQAGISSCLTGRVFTAYGHAWSYDHHPDVPIATGSAAKALSARHCMKPVVCVETGEVFPSITEAGRRYGKNGTGHSNIRCCINGKTKHAYGYTWRLYVTDDLRGS